jgi:hypothetical protein
MAAPGSNISHAIGAGGPAPAPPADTSIGHDLRKANPYYLPDPQHYAIEQERQRHNQAVYSFGEYSIFCLLWTILDFTNGLVRRCARCYLSYGDVADVYEQPSQRRCIDCLGTTFEGGIKAYIVRPAIWTTDSDEIREAPRGDLVINTATVQSTSDFRLSTNDYILREDGSRWQVKTPVTNWVVTGFEVATDARTMVGYNNVGVLREDESSVAYLIPPVTQAGLTSLLLIDRSRTPTDFSAIEYVHGPLVPG